MGLSRHITNRVGSPIVPSHDTRALSGTGAAFHSRSPTALEASQRPSRFFSSDVSEDQRVAEARAERVRDPAGAKISAFYAATMAFRHAKDAVNPFDPQVEPELHKHWQWMFDLLVKAEMERTGQLPLRVMSPAQQELIGGGA
jgi:hypothetical protein